MAFGEAVTKGFNNQADVIANIVEIIGNKTGSRLLVYTPSPGAGNLVGDIYGGSSATTDKYGNPVYPGFASLIPNGSGGYYVAQMWEGAILLFNTSFPPASPANAAKVSLGATGLTTSSLSLSSGEISSDEAITLDLTSGNASQGSFQGFANNGTSELFSLSADIAHGIANVLGNTNSVLNLRGPGIYATTAVLSPSQTAVPSGAVFEVDGNAAVDGSLWLQSVASPPSVPAGWQGIWADNVGDIHSQSPFFVDGAFMALSNAAAPASAATQARPYATTNGNLNVVGSDGNTYSTEKWHVGLPGVIISAVNPVWTNIGPAINVGAQRYAFEIHGNMSSAVAAGIFRMQIAGTAVLGTPTWWHISATPINGGGPPYGGVVNAALTAIQIANPPAATSYWVDAYGEFTVTTAGTIQVQGNTSVAADTWTWIIGRLALEPET